MKGITGREEEIADPRELVVLCRVLLAFSSWKLNSDTHTIGRGHDYLQDTDYTTAETLYARLRRIEREERKALVSLSKNASQIETHFDALFNGEEGRRPVRPGSYPAG